jgi:spore germination protein KC
MKRKRFWMICLFIGTILLSGCWSRKELTDIAIVTGMGIDLSEEGQYQVSFQIVNPGSANPVQQGAGGQATPITTFSSSGGTIMEAIRQTSRKLPRRLFFSHTRIIVISEDVAKEGIKEILDIFERDPEFRLTTTMLLAREQEAKAILSIVTPLERVSSDYILKEVESSQNVLGETLNVEVSEVIQSLTSDGKEVVISGVKIIGNPEEGRKLSNNESTQPKVQVVTIGIGAFEEGKLKGWFEGKEARGVLWVLNKVKITPVHLKCKDDKEAIVVDVIRSNTKLSASVKNDSPKISIEIRAEGNIAEVDCPVDLTKPAEIEKLEKQLEKEIKDEVEDSVQKAQEEQVDIFGFGEAVNRANPKAWKSMKNEWEGRFAELDVNVKVDAYIRRTGLRSNPLLKE